MFLKKNFYIKSFLQSHYTVEAAMKLKHQKLLVIDNSSNNNMGISALINDITHTTPSQSKTTKTRNEEPVLFSQETHNILFLVASSSKAVTLRWGNTQGTLPDCKKIGDKDTKKCLFYCKLTSLCQNMYLSRRSRFW